MSDERFAHLSYLDLVVMLHGVNQDGPPDSDREREFRHALSEEMKVREADVWAKAPKLDDTPARAPIRDEETKSSKKGRR